MNSKQRVNATLDGIEPDRVPVATFAIDFDTVEKILGHETYLRAKAKSKIAVWEGRQDELEDSYVKDHIELHEKLDLDMVSFPQATWQVAPFDGPPPRRVDENTWEDKYGRVYKYSDITADITCVSNPVQEARTLHPEDYEKEPALPTVDKRSWKILDIVIQHFKDEKFIIGPCGGELWIDNLFLGFERGLMELIQNPERVKKALSWIVRQQNLADEVMVHPDSDGVLWGSDYGFKTGPFISPQMFREFFFETNKDRVDNLHDKYGKKVFKHCCGNLNALMDMFVNIGYDVYQSIQPTAGMDICKIKKQYGDRITLWGGVAVEHLISGTADEVRQDVRRAMECAKPSGRFILGSSHSIAVGSNYDNFMAMLDEYHKLCKY